MKLLDFTIFPITAACVAIAVAHAFGLAMPYWVMAVNTAISVLVNRFRSLMRDHHKGNTEVEADRGDFASHCF